MKKNSIRHTFTIIFFLCIFFQQASAQSPNTREDMINEQKDMARAAREVKTSYKKSGMIGVVITSQNCYRELKKKKFYCLYLDAAAIHFEDFMLRSFSEKGYSIPRNEYFSPEKFQERSGEFFVKNFESMDSANKYIDHLNTSIRPIVQREL